MDRRASGQAESNGASLLGWQEAGLAGSHAPPLLAGQKRRTVASSRARSHVLPVSLSRWQHSAFKYL